MIIVIAVLISFIPALVLYRYLRNLKKDPQYAKDCRQLLFRGVLCSLAVAVLAFLFSLGWGAFGPENRPLLKEAFRTFIVAALAEELVKYLSADRTLKQNRGRASRIDCIAWFAIVGIGFQLIETVVYSIESNAGQLIVRGITLGHPAYGMIMGFFAGKYLYTGKKSSRFLAFFAPFFLHGLYDFSLSQELLAVNDNFVFLPFLLIAVELGVLIRMLVLIRKETKKEESEYTVPLPDRQ